MGIGYNTKIVSGGLFYFVDFANNKCYPGVLGDANNVTNLVTQNNSSTLRGNSGAWIFDTTSYLTRTLALNNNGVDRNGELDIPFIAVPKNLNDVANTYNFTVMFAAKKNYYGLGGNNNGNSQLFKGPGNGYDNGWRIEENRGGTPGTAYSSAHQWQLSLNGLYSKLAIDDSVATNRMCIVGFSVNDNTILGFCNSNKKTGTFTKSYISAGTSYALNSTGGGVGCFAGLVGFFMLYDRALSYSEMEQNYNAMRGRYGI
jgi:hypothetical protein